MFGELLRDFEELSYQHRCTKEIFMTQTPNLSLDVREVDRDTLEPILFLLQSPDIEVQRAASAALGNLAVNSE